MSQQEATLQAFLEGAMGAAPDRESKAALHEIFNQAETAKIPLAKLVKPFAQVVVDDFSKKALGDCTAAIFGDKEEAPAPAHAAAKGAKAAAKEDAEDDDDDDDDDKKAKAKPHAHKK